MPRNVLREKLRVEFQIARLLRDRRCSARRHSYSRSPVSAFTQSIYLSVCLRVLYSYKTLVRLTLKLDAPDCFPVRWEFG